MMFAAVAAAVEKYIRDADEANAKRSSSKCAAATSNSFAHIEKARLKLWRLFYCLLTSSLYRLANRI